MVVDYTGDEVRHLRCSSSGRTGDRTSELFVVPTQRFSDKRWGEVACGDEQIAADPALTTTVVTRR